MTLEEALQKAVEARRAEDAAQAEWRAARARLHTAGDEEGAARKVLTDATTASTDAQAAYIALAREQIAKVTRRER